jgi:type I restriction enzyme M protein
MNLVCLSRDGVLNYGPTGARQPGTGWGVIRKRESEMPLELGLIEEAEHRGYLEFDEGRSRVTYLCGRRYSDSFTDPEEVVRAFVYSWLIIEKGYEASRIDVEYPVPRRVPGDRADIVVFCDDDRTDPYLVVEAKEEGCSEAEWRRGIEQGFGNANGLRTTRYLLVDRGRESILYDIQGYGPAERARNRLGERDALAASYGAARRFRLVAGGAQDVRPIDAGTLETRVRRAHAAIWAGGRRDPLTAFDEWSKLLFGKIWDERHTPNGEPRHLQVAANETVSQTASRVRDRFREARRGDPTIFADERIHLPDDKVVEVVRMIEDIGFTLCDVDALGTAFERFFSAVFRGELGQYFTRRELVRFVCGVLRPTDSDFILDPAAGSGGFLLESLIQVWHDIDDRYAGQPEGERRKIEFALHHLYGIEIHGTLSRVCKTNLLIHKDGHTNIEGERSCLDRTFSLPSLGPDASVFTLVVGNPPFGDEIKEGDRDRLGEGSLGDFELSQGYGQVSSELVIIERALQFLVPGGRLGMVVPDGALNNSGEGSRCPAFRRFLLRNAGIEMVVSLPDYAFRKAGAQNKTSLLFVRKFTAAEKRAFDAAYHEALASQHAAEGGTAEQEKRAIRNALARSPYRVFLAEVEDIGYTPAGAASPRNQLYSVRDAGLAYGDRSTVLGQYSLYLTGPDEYTASRTPSCHSVSIVDVLDAHRSYRLDPKFHLFQIERIHAAPPHMTEYRLGDLLRRSEDEIDPTGFPDEEFLTLTLRQDGTLARREAGKGTNPPSWHGAYFSRGSRWFRAHAGDLIVSQIDLWKGCVAVIAAEYDQAIVTQEFPLYQVDVTRLDPRYLALLLRTQYFQRAIRAITTGHSNRRRTQSDDFEELRVFVPDLETQRTIATLVEGRRRGITQSESSFLALLADVEEVVMGEKDPTELIGE